MLVVPIASQGFQTGGAWQQEVGFEVETRMSAEV
jgi:hypothetical protein